MNNNKEMNSTPVLIINPSSEETVLNQETDIESQVLKSEDSLKKIADTQPVLKGILKKPEVNENLEQDGLMIVKLCTSSCILICMSPIIICDLYFGFSHDSCLTDEPKNLNFNLKTYLIVSGFSGLFILLFMLFAVCSISKNADDKNVICFGCLGCAAMLCSVFGIIWNTIGAVTFWAFIYPDGSCNKVLSTYLFVSLIIKYVGVIQNLLSNKNKKERR